MNFLRIAILGVAIVALFNTCKKDDDDKPVGKDQTVYNVTLTDKTVYIDSLAVESLASVDNENYIYNFYNDDPVLSGIEVGDILLLHGLALRRVSDMTVEGDETRVETEYATLNEAIADGEISWNKEIKFNKGVQPVVYMGGKEIARKSTKEDGFEFEFTYGEYTYGIKFNFTEEQADIAFEISKDLAGPIGAKFTATGTLSSFSSETEIEYEGSELIRFDQHNTGLQGELTLNLTVAGTGRDEITFDFPVVLLAYPVMVGPIPVIINLKVLFVINCVVPVDGSSQVEAKFTYNSTTGVQYNGTDVSANASVGDYQIGKNITQTGASSAIAANFGLAFPRLEIGIFDDVIVPYAQTAFLIGGDYTFTPACQQARAQFIGACGVDLSFLGFSYSANKTLWQEEKVLLQSGDCE